MPSPLFFILPLSPAHYRHLRHIVTNRLIIYVFCVTQGVTINSASHGGLTCAVKLRLGVVGAVIGGPPVAIFFTSTPQSRLTPCQLPVKGSLYTPSVYSLTLIASSLDREPFGLCPNSYVEPPSLREVDASETSRRREFMRPERPNHLLQLCCLMYSSD